MEQLSPSQFPMIEKAVVEKSQQESMVAKSMCLRQENVLECQKNL